MRKITVPFLALALLAGAANVADAQGKPKTTPKPISKSATPLKLKIDKSQDNERSMKERVAQYAMVPLKTDLGRLSEKERDLIGIFIEIADIIDDIYWDQVFGNENRRELNKVRDPEMRRFASIQYGAWDRLNGNSPFLPGYGEKPAGSNFYPADMTKEEFEKLKDPMKTSPYTLLRRNAKKELEVIPYSHAYKKELAKIDELLKKAIEITDDEGLKNYLQARREALMNDDFQKSDFLWMDMKESRLDFVFGPIENYEDGLFGYKTAYEAFVLVKDEDWSKKLKHFTALLPEMQKRLPCDAKYKKEKPGTESDLFVYDVVYYAGECNAGGKTIAINLPNDEEVQLRCGTRRLQLKNAMEAKFDMILTPIANQLINKEQTKHVKFDAFFNNVCFHEVAHGLGIKNTIDGKGTVRQALKNQFSAWEEAKADICGLFMVRSLIEKGEIKGISVEDAYVTYMAGLLRSVRFGAKEAHGIANIMCFNFMYDKGAFKRSEDGHYTVDIAAMSRATEEWASLILKMEGDGDYKAASDYAAKHGVVRKELEHDLKTLEKVNIPVDIVFEQGHKVLDVKRSSERENAKQAIIPNKSTQIELRKK